MILRLCCGPKTGIKNAGFKVLSQAHLHWNQTWSGDGKDSGMAGLLHAWHMLVHITSNKYNSHNAIIHIHLLYQDDQFDPDCRVHFLIQGTCEAIAGIPNSRLGQAALAICLHLTRQQPNESRNPGSELKKSGTKSAIFPSETPWAVQVRSDRPPSDIAVLDDRGTCLRPYKGYEPPN